VASFLDGMAGSIYAGFKGQLRKGVIVRNVSGGLDSHGRPNGAILIGAPVEGFPDDYSEFFRAQAGIPATDLKVNLFAASIAGLRPQKDDRVRFDFPATASQPAYSQWYQLRAAATDPATVLWVCRGYAVARAPDSFQLDLAALLQALAETVNEDMPEIDDNGS
jgi:hypothetical protein